MEEREYQFPTGADCSRLLVDRTHSYLDDMHDGNATHADVAQYLGVTQEKMQEVLQGRATFGLVVFERLAAQNRQALKEFMLILIRWRRQEREITGEDD